MDRAHATDIGQRAGFHHGEEDEWNENGFHGGAFQTVGGSEPGSLGKDNLVFVIIRPT